MLDIQTDLGIKLYDSERHKGAYKSGQEFQSLTASYVTGGLTDVAGAYNGNDLFTNNEVTPVEGAIAAAPIGIGYVLKPLRRQLGRAWRYVRGADKISDEISAAGIAIAKLPNNPAHNAADFGKLKKSLASEQQMAEAGQVIAGGASGVKFRNAESIANNYGGSVADWVKKSSGNHTTPNGTIFETHWVENLKTGLRVEYKTTFPNGIGP